MSLDLLVCALCASIFKGKRVIVYKWLSVVHLVVCELGIVLQISASNCIGMLQLVHTYVLQQTIGLYCILWILVVSNDPDAGTALDRICCFCSLSAHAGSHSICRS